jgi:hypothetical protein
LQVIVIEAGADRHGRRSPVKHIQERVRCWPADPRSIGAAGLGDVLGLTLREAPAALSIKDASTIVQVVALRE